MYLLKSNLERYGTRPVWFNAWHHQKEDQLLAALLEAIKRDAAPRVWDRDWFKFRARLLAKRLRRYAGYAVALVLVAVGVLWTEVKLQEHNYSMLAGAAYYLDHWFGKASEAATQAAAAAKALRDEASRWAAEAKDERTLASQLEAHAKKAHSGEDNAWRATAENLSEAAREANLVAEGEQLPGDDEPFRSARIAESTTPSGLLQKTLLDQADDLRRHAAIRSKRAKLLASKAEPFTKRELAEALQPDQDHPFKFEPRASSFKRIPLASVFTALGLLLVAGFKCLVAFGVNPSALLEGAKGTKGPRAAKEKAGVRSRFAAEFADVTWAHGPKRTLLILIDDLDRCRPDKVREVLEAVNFLVSNGDCFVVLGMDPAFVNQCLGLSFGDVVNAMPATALGLKEDARPEDKRDLFARRYLEKLIQIEVAIPEPSPEQQPRLFTREQVASEERVQSYLTQIGHLQAAARGLLHLAGEAVFGLSVVVLSLKKK